ncbi:hypothetical protein BAUCODRAFT_269193 [Baudoinia panamericana UAMH 10762]|uniref:Uncharacterized protein n=1 Tax=Baudoinia panamericana (strain UAMH 10762) TaxID=717646 RepID=M2M9B6_BAUPA|nr:uncharacterized protein BAUCODRAFT_269193 [Baudoinia panamericana UAMH 10762]EMC92981.1 hypothetical protein BAUCODRAFT_269193 [Baudoinia panamericana UAMH 10762]
MLNPRNMQVSSQGGVRLTILGMYAFWYVVEERSSRLNTCTSIVLSLAKALCSCEACPQSLSV